MINLKKRMDTIGGVVGFIIAACLCLFVFQIESIWLTMLISIPVAFGFAFLFSLFGEQADDKKAQKNHERYMAYSKETRATVDLLREKIDAERLNNTYNNRQFLDKHNIPIVFGTVKRYFFILKDAQYGYCMVDSKDGAFYFNVPSILIEQHVDDYYKYNEPTLVYTGATVGGVTTGGFHVEGGDYSTKKHFTGKYYHYFSLGGEHVLISHIYCNTSVWEKAKKDIVTKNFIYGKNDYIYLAHVLSSEQQKHLARAASTGDASLDGSFARAQLFAQESVYLTREECDEIKNWILQILKT